MSVKEQVRSYGQLVFMTRKRSWIFISVAAMLIP